jgi:hypothetical protein
MSLLHRRQLAAALAVPMLVAWPLSGCGGSSASNAKTSSPASRGSSSVPASAGAGNGGVGNGGGSNGAARSRALAYAREVNLRAADVPKMTARGTEGEKAQVGSGALELSKCSGATSPTARVADVHSRRFVARSNGARESVRSDVEVKASAAQASHDATTLKSRRALVCIKRLLQRTLASELTPGSSARVQRQVSVQALAPPLPADRTSFGVRILLTLSAAQPTAQRTVRSYFDVLGFAAGPAEIGLTARSTRRPVPSATEQHLLSLLHSRATAHKLS